VTPLRQDNAFFREVIDTFRSDCSGIIATIGQAGRAGDTAAFDAGLRALRHKTGRLGSERLRDLLNSMRGQTPMVLRQQGMGYVEMLDAELRRLDAALSERLRAAN